jgi:SAM-dependent methyltransferase
MGLRSDQREWDDLAARDAMWAVCSLPGLRGRWSATAFFESGEAEVGGVLGGLESAGLAPTSRQRALDFGCGLGRLTRALAERFEEVVGVDLSEEMIGKARQLNADRLNCRFIANHRHDLSVLPTSHFDFVLSLIALQHVSSRAAIRSYVQEFVRVTAPGGVLAFQLPVRVGWQLKAHPLRVANRVARTLPRAPGGLLKTLMPYSMKLTAIPEDEVRAVLVEAGAHVETAFDDRRTGTPAVPSFFYVARVPRQ